jgi:hypothetical protein
MTFITSIDCAACKAIGYGMAGSQLAQVGEVGVLQGALGADSFVGIAHEQTL